MSVVADGSTLSSCARFPIELQFPDGPPEILQHAAEAVRREYRESVRWKRLCCRRVEPMSPDGEDGIFILDVGQSIEFDWTWEGALAFRPPNIQTFDGNADSTDDFVGTPRQNGNALVWKGEVIEVDAANGRLFVWMGDPQSRPTIGSFYVRPFEFLAFLNAVYTDPAISDLRNCLAARLVPCRGGIHPAVRVAPTSGLPPLKDVWRHSWGILWGPPGTGKTYTIGRQLAACLNDNSERILVVSTTNKATDEVALSIARASRDADLSSVEDGRILRIGKSAHHEGYEREGLEGLLRGTETDLLRQIGALSRQLARTHMHDERAVLQKQLQELRRLMKDTALKVFVSPNVKVVVSTAFKVTTLLCDPAVRAIISQGATPFTTVIIDEAGLISRAAAAVLSLLASRRVLLVGDSKQLAPISRISRILPTHQATWLASSGLTHLRSLEETNPAVHLLREQYRMHPQVCNVVSAFQYENKLVTAQAVHQRKFAMPAFLEGQPQAIWYVLDEDGDDIPSIRAERGPGNRSWTRPKTRSVLAKFFSDAQVRETRGLFVSPFAAQAKDINKFLSAEGLPGWSGATVHSQQGTEADFVIFDTVNAGSCAWPFDEWKRLLNVGLSRARHFILVLASRAEMREPYLKALMAQLAPRILRQSGRTLKWLEVPAEVEYKVPEVIAGNPDLIGHQLAIRKQLRPVMSGEQQRLCGFTMDGKPRLVRGVAGSGKTVVLAHWLLQTMQSLRDKSEGKIWAVFANIALKKLITDTIEEAWNTEGDGSPIPWNRVEFYHIIDVLRDLLSEVHLPMARFKYDYDAAAAEYLARRSPKEITPRCDAIFINEAQDMGPNTLKLLSALVGQSDGGDPNSRSVNIFYDNAQNLYGRTTPKWSELGLDMRGRSTVLKESFRSTKPVTEFALNVLYRLQPPEEDADHKELIERGLIEPTERNGQTWWNVRFNQVNGPQPIIKKYENVEKEIDALGNQIVSWIRNDGVRPGDICVLYIGDNIAWRLQQQVAPKLEAIGAKLIVQTSQGFNTDQSTVLVTTPHSFKGHDAEIIVVAGVDQFIAKGKGILSQTLYVAMTRARSILAVFGKQSSKPEPTKLLSVLQNCLDAVVDRPVVEKEISDIDEFEDVLAEVGPERRAWLEELWKKFELEHEPIRASDGEILGEPVFWFRNNGRTHACFGKHTPGISTRHKLEDAGIEVLPPGAAV